MNLPDTIPNDKGKPPILVRDKDRVKNVLMAVRKGHSTTMAAQAGGISRRTLYDWREKGEEVRRLMSDNPEELPLTPYDDAYLDFIKKWDKAEYERKEELVRRIDKAGEEKWQANAWLLERLHPEEFSNKKHVTVSGPDRRGDTWTLKIGDKTAALGGDDIEEADYEIVS